MSSHDLFLRLFHQMWPNMKAPTVEYDVNPPRPSDPLQSISYTARIRLLGQVLSAHGHYGSPEEAANAAFKVALDVLQEFKRLLDLSTTNASQLTTSEQEYISVMMKSLEGEARELISKEETASAQIPSATTAINKLTTALANRQNEQIEVGVKKRTSAITQKFEASPPHTPSEASRMERLRQKLLSEMQEIKSPASESGNTEDRVRDSVMQSSSTTAFAPTDPRITSTAPVYNQKQSNQKKTVLLDPITTLYEYVDKLGLSPEQLIFQEFRHQNKFGCRLLWNNQSWISPATCPTKKEAKMRAALMACIEILGNGFEFEGIDPGVYSSWTPEYFEQLRERYIFRSTSELLFNTQGKTAPSTSTPSASTKKDDTPPLTPLPPLPNGRKYLTELNQLCQRLKWPLPVFTFTSINAVNNYFVCSVHNFQEYSVFESAPFTKKVDAKEDVAGRVYLTLKDGGYLEEAAARMRQHKETGRYWEAGNSKPGEVEKDKSKEADSGRSRSREVNGERSREQSRGRQRDISRDNSNSMDIISELSNSHIHSTSHSHSSLSNDYNNHSHSTSHSNVPYPISPLPQLPQLPLPPQPQPHLHLMQMQLLSSSFYYLTRMQAQLVGNGPPLTPQEFANMNQLMQQHQQLMIMSMSSMSSIGGMTGGLAGGVMNPMNAMSPIGQTGSMNHINSMNPSWSNSNESITRQTSQVHSSNDSVNRSNVPPPPHHHHSRDDYNRPTYDHRERDRRDDHDRRREDHEWDRDDRHYSREHSRDYGRSVSRDRR